VGYLAVGVELLAAAGALALSRRQWRRLGAALAGPAGALVSVIGRIGDGDLEARAVGGDVRELEEIAGGLNRMAARIADQQRSVVESEWRARQIGELSPDGVGIMDTTGRVVYANPALGRLLGYPDPTGLIGLTGDAFMTSQSTQIATDRRTAVIGGATVRGSHETFRRQDGELVDVDIHSARCDVGDGPGVLSVIRDATDQRRTEAALHAAVVQEQEVTVRLRAVDQARTDLVATVSHELRTPLTSINGYVEMLVDGDAGEVTPEQREMLEAVERNGKRLLNLIEDLLAQSRLDSGNFRLVRAPLVVSELIGRCEEAIAPLAAARGHHLQVEADTAGAMVEGDANALERVILNLLSNAIKFTPENGHIELVAEATDQEVTMTVSDDGIGIPPEEQSQLFGRFFRSSVAEEQFIQGTGLGLAISKGIVEEHGGHIAVSSAPGQGTRFRVTLPRVADRLVAASS
ncbi:MAG: PAS domain-containing sensor histidine kinase, partial [Actinomycetes bacterium]